jgi:hypothetical protein
LLKRAWHNPSIFGDKQAWKKLRKILDLDYRIKFKSCEEEESISLNARIT